MQVFNQIFEPTGGETRNYNIYKHQMQVFNQIFEPTGGETRNHNNIYKHQIQVFNLYSLYMHFSVSVTLKASNYEL